MRSLGCGRMAWALAAAIAALATAWPRTAPAADDPNMEYLVKLAFADHCKQVLPWMTGQVDSALAAWKARLPAQQLASLQSYADSKPGKSTARSVGIAIGAASNGNKLIVSHECARNINEWGLPAYPQVARSQIDPEQNRALVASIAPLVLARLDCLVLDGVDTAADSVAAAGSQAKPTQPVPMERWVFSACGRTHSVSIWPRQGKYNLSAKDTFDLSGM